MAGKKRLDTLLVEKGLFPSREKAKGSIMAGLIKIDGRVFDKPGTEVPENSDVEVVGPAIPYVSRGGLKLEKAISEFQLDFKGKVVVDIGASTGGFTDCALQNGAVKVYAIDVGYGQLDWKLRQDSRVVSLERTNFRYFDKAVLAEKPDLVTIDVSFISLEKILPGVAEILSNGGLVVALIKPQFEAGREKVGKKGVVRDPETHISVIEKVIDKATQTGFLVKEITYSPVKGPEGNIEYLLFLEKNDEKKDQENETGQVRSLVEKATKNLT